LTEADSTIAPLTTVAWFAGGGAWLVTKSCSTCAALTGAGGKPELMDGTPVPGATRSEREFLPTLTAVGDSTWTSNVPPLAVSRGAPDAFRSIPEPGILAWKFLPPSAALGTSSPPRADDDASSPCWLRPTASGGMIAIGPANAGCAAKAAIAQAHSNAVRPPAYPETRSWYAKRTTALLSPLEETRLDQSSASRQWEPQLG